MLKSKNDTSPSRPRGRFLGSNALLVAVIAAAILLICSIVGILSYLMVATGAVGADYFTHPAFELNTMLFISILLTTSLTTLIYFAFIRPLRAMTRAMGKLAKGDFSVRLPEQRWLHPHDVHEYACGFNAAAEELGSLEGMREQFMSDFSHEFQTPISTIAGFADLLQEDGMTERDRLEFLAVISSEAKRLARLSDRILFLSKMETAAILPDKRSVSLGETLRLSMAVVEPKKNKKAITIEPSIEECEILGNKDYLIELWVNLLDNAIKYAPDGSTVTVRCATDRSTASDHKAKESRIVHCEILDQGPGMDAQTLARLFERFYQGDSSHSAEGSGLGLSLCKRIAELHGGSIRVESERGRGSTFVVTLPLDEVI